MIAFNKVDQQVRARVDAVGTDHYDLNLARIPAVNAAQHLVQSALSSLIEGKKFSGEALRDLNWTAVFQTSEFGQIDLDRLLGTATINYIPHKLWTVLAVYPEFRSSEAQTLTTDPIPVHSLLRQDVRFVSPVKAAKHYTQEQWASAQGNIFAPGSPLMTNAKLKEYGYLLGTRTATNTGPTSQVMMSILGTPPVGRQLVAVSYLKVASTVSEMPLEEGDTLYTQTMLEWPDSMEELIVTAAHRILSVKQGDGTTLHSLSMEEMGMLLQTVS
jgi:hypothetical protein